MYGQCTSDITPLIHSLASKQTAMLRSCPVNSNLETPELHIVSSMWSSAGGGKGVKDGKGKQKKKAQDEEAGEEDTYYDAMKKDMGDRAARTKVLHLLYFTL